MKKAIMYLVICAMVVAMIVPFPIAVSAATSGTCGENATWSFDEETETLTISGTGAMANYGYSTEAPWNEHRGNITSVVIGEGITTIGNRTLYNCYNLIEGVTIPDGVTSIGEDAFYCCYKLTSVTIPDSVVTIGRSAFSWCEDMSVLRMGKGVASIGANAFNACTSLTDIYYNGSKAQWRQISKSIDGNTALYSATLHTVEPTVTEISVKSQPAKTEYELGEAFDATGLILTATYSDGSTADITEGFTASGFDSTTAGTKTITVTYEGKTATFSVEVVDNGPILEQTIEGAIKLLQYIDGLDVDLTDEVADVSGDGKVTVFDAVCLLQIIAAQ